MYAPPIAVVNVPALRTLTARPVLIGTWAAAIWAVRFTLGQDTHPLHPGSVAVIPAGVPHSLAAEPGQELEFVIFGTPPMTMDDERAKPVKPVKPVR